MKFSDSIDFTSREENEWPETALSTLRSVGYLSRCVGVDCSWTEMLSDLRELGYADLALGRIVEGHLNGLDLVHRFGTQRQFEDMLAAIIEGGLSAIWDSEIPGKGLGFSGESEGAIRLNGTKHFASAAGRTTCPVVTAQRSDRDEDACPDGRQLLILPMAHAGAKVDDSRPLPIGVRATRTYAVSFEGSVLPDSVLLGDSGDYLKEPFLTAGASRFLALWVGAFERLLELVRLEHQKTGSPRRSEARRRTAELAGKVWQSRCMLDQLASVLEVSIPTEKAFTRSGDSGLLRGASNRAANAWSSERVCAQVMMARQLLEATGHEILALAQQAIGLKGMISGHPLERLTRDLTIYLRQPATDSAAQRAGQFVLDGAPGTSAPSLWSPVEPYRSVSRLLAGSALVESNGTVCEADRVFQMGKTLVVAPHPDDETLGAGGTIALLRERGLPVRIIFLTDGEGSHPGSREFPPARVAELRREEARAACAALGVDDFHFWGMPDGGLAQSGETGFGEALRLLAEELKNYGPHTILTTWRRDRHGDHRAAAQLCHAACDEIAMEGRPRIFEFPIWVWEARSVAEAPDRDEVARWDIDISSVYTRKEAALECHDSQLGRRISDDPEGFSLTARHLTRFAKEAEIFLVSESEANSPAISPDFFEAKYRGKNDPWGYEDNPYETDKYAHLLQMLGESRFARGLELGCSIGVLTDQLAQRCDSLKAMDVSETAIGRAKERMCEAGHEHVDLLRGFVPRDLPTSGNFDLIVLSEFAYYLEAEELRNLQDYVDSHLAPGGVLVLMHWTVYVRHHPLTGDEVHEAFKRLSDTAGYDTLASGRSAFYRWNVWKRPEAVTESRWDQLAVQ